jgi:putative PIN family toxin of toxin-antitoxin system
MRVVVDTNLIINRTISPTGAAGEILRRWRQERFELLVSEAILAEYKAALGYPRVRARHGLSNEEIADFVNQFRRFAVLVTPTVSITVVHDDPDDDKFVECAITGAADFIVSRDAHLLALGTYQNIQILPPAAFLAILKATE